MPEEYVSREAALKDFESCNAENPRWTPQRVKTLLLRQPAADVAEVVHGRWILHDDGVFTCSECGNAESNDSYYCRLCGAKMDGGCEDA